MYELKVADDVEAVVDEEVKLAGRRDAECFSRAGKLLIFTINININIMVLAESLPQPSRTLDCLHSSVRT